MEKNPTKTTDLGVRRSNKKFLDKLEDARQAAEDLDRLGHRIHNVDLQSDLPVITISEPSKYTLDGDVTVLGANMAQTILKRHGRETIHVVWERGDFFCE